MASIVKIKRSSVQGKAPTVSDIQSGELALNTRDGKLFSSDGSGVFEVGANLSSLSVTTSLTTPRLTITDSSQTDVVTTIFNSNPSGNTTSLALVNDTGELMALGITGSGFVASGNTQINNEVGRTIGYMYPANTVDSFVIGNKANTFIYGGGDGLGFGLGTGVGTGSNVAIAILNGNIIKFNNIFQFPTNAPANNQILVSDAGGILSWQDQTGGNENLAFKEYSYTASNGQLSFGGTDDFGQTLTYTPTNISVFLNGIKLIANTDYLASNSTSVFLSTAASNNDVLDIQAFTTVQNFVDVSADLTANQENISSASTPVIVDSFSQGDYTSAKYMVQGVTANGSGIQTSEVLLIHYSGEAWVTEYATVNTISTFLDIDAVVSSNVELRVTSDYANTDIKFTRLGITPRI